ncbi:hypothetical protein [Alishewanella longhuensis]|nr:hypothetical protein [Alishewanella longhuensis]
MYSTKAAGITGGFSLWQQGLTFYLQQNQVECWYYQVTDKPQWH